MSDPLQALLGPIFQARQEVTPDFLSRQQVVACGVGYKIKGTQQTTTPSVIVSVTRKLPPDQLHPSDLIPAQIDGVLTDVVETGEITAFGVNRTAALRPARPGVSIGNINGATGTIGCVVQRGGQRFILSNNHVLANLNAASPGDAILQPGTADGGTLADQIATLTQFAPIVLTQEAAMSEAMPVAVGQSTQPQGCAAVLAQTIQLFSRRPPAAPPAPPPVPSGNLVDAAIAAVLSDSLLDPNIIDIGSPPQGFAEPKLGMQIFKCGRTSGLTEGIITQVDVTVDVKYDTRVARFTNQIMITPCSQPGNSGSLVLDFQRNAVGLLFSGSNLITVASPINAVLKILNVELVTAAMSGAPSPDFG